MEGPRRPPHQTLTPKPNRNHKQVSSPAQARHGAELLQGAYRREPRQGSERHAEADRVLHDVDQDADMQRLEPEAIHRVRQQHVRRGRQPERQHRPAHRHPYPVQLVLERESQEDAAARTDQAAEDHGREPAAWLVSAVRTLQRGPREPVREQAADWQAE